MHVHVLKLFFFFFLFFSKNECVVFTEMQALVNREMIATAIFFPPHILVLALLMFLQQYYSYGTTHATQYQEIFELGQAFDI